MHAVGHVADVQLVLEISGPHAAEDVLAHFARHIIPLNAVHGRVFVGVLLLYLFVVTFDKAENLLVGGVGFSDELTGITVSYIFSRHVERLEIHDLVFHDILNLFDA